MDTHHDTKVIKREFQVGNLVLRRNPKDFREGKLGLWLDKHQENLRVDLTEPDKVLEYLQLDKNQVDLRVDLTEPEKAFDWIRIRKILGSI